MNRFSQVAFGLVLGCCVVSLSGCSRVPQTEQVGILPSRSLADLKNALLVAYVNKDEVLLQNLIYPERVSAAERATRLDTAREHWQRPIEDVSDKPMIEGMGLDAVIGGKRYEGNLKPLGFVRIGFAEPTNQTSKPSAILYPYGVKDGAYYLVASVLAK